MVDPKELQEWWLSAVAPRLPGLSPQRQEDVAAWFEETLSLMVNQPGGESTTLASTLAMMQARRGVRDLLIGLAQVGLMAPEEVEGLAGRFAVGPLAERPRHEGFDPEAELGWTLPMATAWIATRSIEVVRDQMAEYRGRWFEWSPRERRRTPSGVEEGWHLKSMNEDRSLADVLLSADTVTLCSVTEAWLSLREALSEPRIESYGVPGPIMLSTPPDGPIPHYLWLRLAMHPGGRGDCVEDRDARGVVAFHRVSVKRGDVVKLWPAATGSRNPAAGGRLKKEREAATRLATEWLRETYMAKSPARQTHTQRQLYPMAKERWPLLGKSTFERVVWKAAASRFPAWSAGGTPPART